MYLIFNVQNVDAIGNISYFCLLDQESVPTNDTLYIITEFNWN